MALHDRKPKGYTLRLELRDDQGSVFGEVSARFSDDALGGLIRRATSGSPSPGEGSNNPRPFHGHDDNRTVARGDERAMSTERQKFLAWRTASATRRMRRPIRWARRDGQNDDLSASHGKLASRGNVLTRSRIARVFLACPLDAPEFRSAISRRLRADPSEWLVGRPCVCLHLRGSE
jgi:hypothetical protein